jgi:hypothetical protein
MSAHDPRDKRQNLAIPLQPGVVVAACLMGSLLGGCDAMLRSGGDNPTESGPGNHTGSNGGSGNSPHQPDPASFVPPGPTLRLLTHEQYRATLRTLFSFADSINLSGLQEDVALNGSRAVGASIVALSSKETEEYLAIAESAAAKALGSSAQAEALLGCSPEEISCAQSLITDFGKRAFRRSLTEEENARYFALFEKANSHFVAEKALEHVVTALLISPHFLYRVEIGEPETQDHDRRILSDTEIASKLAYFLWDAPPDETLLTRAETEDLRDPTVLREEAERLMEDERFRQGLRGLFNDYLSLFEMNLVEKLPAMFPEFTPSLRSTMAQETLLNLEHATLAEADFRSVFESTSTYVNGELAAHYGLPGVLGSDFVQVEIPSSSLRRGLLGNASLLSLYAHPSTSSPTLRGKFVREALLCQGIPAPPPNVDTALPPATETTTTRERFALHSSEPACANCHQLMDPIGLGLEHFDAVGVIRMQENGMPIDASGELDGVSFENPIGLAEAIAAHPYLPGCFARNVFRYGWGRLESGSDEALLTALGESFEKNSYRVRALILDTVTSTAFYETGKLD